MPEHTRPSAVADTRDATRAYERGFKRYITPGPGRYWALEG